MADSKAFQVCFWDIYAEGREKILLEFHTLNDFHTWATEQKGEILDTESFLSLEKEALEYFQGTEKTPN